MDTIESNKKLKFSHNEKLDDLLQKMLKIKVNERISWDEYFNHPFFNDDNFESFNFNCDKHLKIINNYCIECKKNICEDCLKDHSKHKIIAFNHIGLNENEINRMENIINEINNNLNSFNTIKNEIEDLFMKMKSIKENELIYINDIDNNYKEYYIKYFEKMNKILKHNEIKLINLNLNEIICIYDFQKSLNDKDDNLNKSIRILNCYEETKKAHSDWDFEGTYYNEKEIKENCQLYLNKKKINFNYNYFLNEDEDNYV